MRFLLFPAALASALFGIATPLASAADEAAPHPALSAEAGVEKHVGTAASPNAIPEPEIPYQVVAFAGALLIWRNRRRTSQG